MSEEAIFSGPIRAHDLILRIGADTVDDLVFALRTIAEDAQRKGLSRWSTSGAPSVGWMLSYRTDPDQTHDAYFRQIDEWLAKRDSEATPPSTPETSA